MAESSSPPPNKVRVFSVGSHVADDTDRLVRASFDLYDVVMPTSEGGAERISDERRRLCPWEQLIEPGFLQLRDVIIVGSPPGHLSGADIASELRTRRFHGLLLAGAETHAKNSEIVRAGAFGITYALQVDLQILALQDTLAKTSPHWPR